MTAAAARKLQKDIEVALKKVEDGKDEFDSTWEQATTCSNSGHKEKLGEELKKSISKLQRLRVQIREWIGSSEVKATFKDKLESARKQIEADMLRFKEFERGLKTKAYSSCALAKGGEELELAEIEKIKSQDWLEKMIQTVGEHLEGFEADLEVLQNKKSLSNDDKDRQTHIKTMQERHQWHSKKLELILRGLDNDAVDVTDLAVVQDCVECYVDMHDDPDYPHDETLYDCFDLQEFEIKEALPRTPHADEDGDTPVPESKAAKKEKEKRKKDEKKDKKKEDKKAATPISGGASNKSANSGKNATVGPVGAFPSAAEESILGKVAEEEFKVQADQLLLGGEAEEFVCKICQTHVVGMGPTLTNCSHLFCGDCLGQWFNAHPDNQSWAQRAKAAGPERVVPCPVCKQPLNEKRDLYPVCGATSRSENLLLWRMLSSLKIMCINHSRMRPDGKCEWVGEYGQYQKHIKSCERQEGGGASPCPASMPVAAPTVTPVPVRTPEPRALSPVSAPLNVVEKSPTAVPERSSYEAAPLPPVAAKLPSPKLEHIPQALQASSPVAAPARSAPVFAPKSVSATSAPIPATSQEMKSPTAGAAFLPVADDLRSNTVEVSAPVAQVKIQPAVQAKPLAVSAAPQSQLQQQPVASVQQPRKAVVPAAVKTVVPQEPEGSFLTKATSAFEPTGPNMVSASVGDTIQVLERHATGWTYCKNMSAGSSGITGWAPSWFVASADADEAASIARKARAKEQEAAANAPAPAPAPAPVAAPFVKESSLLVGQKLDLHPVVAGSRQTTQPAVAAAPTPQHSMQAAPVAPKAPSTKVSCATASFSASSTSQLSVTVGDLVEIVESHSSGWTYGRQVHAPVAGGVIEGWFPEWVCAQK